SRPPRRYRNGLASGRRPLSSRVVGASFSPLWEKYGHRSRDFLSPSARSNLASDPSPHVNLSPRRLNLFGRFSAASAANRPIHILAIQGRAFQSAAIGLCLRPASTVRSAKLFFIVRRLAVADKILVLKIDANQHLEFFGRPGLLEAGKKEARGRGLALSSSRGAGGDSMGGFAGL